MKAFFTLMTERIKLEQLKKEKERLEKIQKQEEQKLKRQLVSISPNNLCNCTDGPALLDRAKYVVLFH